MPIPPVSHGVQPGIPEFAQQHPGMTAGLMAGAAGLGLAPLVYGASQAMGDDVQGHRLESFNRNRRGASGAIGGGILGAAAGGLGGAALGGSMGQGGAALPLGLLMALGGGLGGGYLGNKLQRGWDNAWWGDPSYEEKQSSFLKQADALVYRLNR